MSEIRIADGPDKNLPIQFNIYSAPFLISNDHVSLFLDEKTADDIVFKLGSKLQDLEREKKS